jgi:hypothetical protein
MATGALAEAGNGLGADPVVTALKQRDVYVGPDAGITPAQVRLARADARRLARAGFPTKYAFLDGPVPRRFIPYSGVVRRRVGRDWNVVLTWRIPGAPRLFAYAFDSPVGPGVEARVARETEGAFRERSRGRVRFAMDVAARLSWYGRPTRAPRGGRLLQLDADPPLERLVRLPAAVRFPAASFPGTRLAVVDDGRTTPIGPAGERVATPQPVDLFGTGSLQLLIRVASGNSVGTTQLLAWDGTRARTLWTYRPQDFENASDLGLLVAGPGPVSFPDLDGDGIREIQATATLAACRACTPEEVLVATYRFDASIGRYLLAGVAPAT